MNIILEKENDEIYKLLNCIFNIGVISTDYINDNMTVLKRMKDKI